MVVCLQVVGPPKAGAYKERPAKPTSFRKFYDRGDFPIALEHDTKGNKIAWKVTSLSLPQTIIIIMYSFLRLRLRSWITIITCPCSLMVCVRLATPMSSLRGRVFTTCWSTVDQRYCQSYRSSLYPSKVRLPRHYKSVKTYHQGLQRLGYQFLYR